MNYEELPKYCYKRKYCDYETKCPYKSLCSRFFKKYGLVPSVYYKIKEIEKNDLQSNHKQ